MFNKYNTNVKILSRVCKYAYKIIDMDMSWDFFKNSGEIFDTLDTLLT